MPPLDPVIAARYPDGRISDHLQCVTCEYHLFSLKPQETCPECGTPIERSAKGNQLRYADPSWIEALRRGAGWVIVATACNLLLGIIGAVLDAWLARSIGVLPMEMVSLLLDVLTAALWFYAIWLFTMPEPRAAMEDLPFTLGRVVRTSAGIAVLGPMIELAMTLSGLTAAILPEMIGLVFALAGLVAWLSLLVHARRLALRIPNDGLAQQTRVVIWGLAISYSWIVAMGIAAVVLVRSGLAGGAAPGAGFGGSLVALGLCICTAGLGVLVFAVWSFILTCFYYGHFGQAAIYAREFARQF